MIIGIDASKLITGNPTGVEVVTADLISAILRNDKNNTYWLYSSKPLPEHWLKNDNVKNVVVPGKRLWTQLYLSHELKRRPPEAFWSPSHILPNNLPKKSVATIHDLAFSLFPQSYPLKEQLLSLLAVKKAIKHASQLVAVSQQTKKDLKKYFKVPGENIEVVYHALRSDFVSSDKDLATLYPGLDKYFLYVGRLELRKNLPNIIQAFALFNRTHPEVKLVLAGGQGYGYATIKKLIKKTRLTDKVVLLNYIPAENLSALYKGAIGLVFVSQYEGFGLTILEGFASNVPVLTSNFGAMAEVAGPAGLLVDPKDTKAIAKGMQDLYTDEKLQEILIAKGKNQLLKFDWDKSAQKMIELWNRL